MIAKEARSKEARVDLKLEVSIVIGDYSECAGEGRLKR
jgi:hypothetical protein